MSLTTDSFNVDLNVLGRVTNLINSTHKLSVLLETIMASAKEILQVESCSLLLIDHEKKVLNFDVVIGEKGEIIKKIEVPIGKGIAGLVAETGEPVIVSDAENDPRIFKEVDEKTDNITRNLICVPMKVKDKIVGVLEAINSLSQPDFTDDQLQILRYLADQAAIAINNSELFRELTRARLTLQKRVNELLVLHEFSNIVNFAISLKELIPLSLSFIRKSFDVKSAIFYLYNTDSNKFNLYYSLGIQNIEPATKEIALSDNMKAFLDRHSSPGLIQKDIPSGLSFLKLFEPSYPILLVPLFSENQLFGIIFLWDKINEKPFNSSEIKQISSLASHLSQAYSNLLLNESLLEKTQVRQELKVASLIQQKILPISFNAPQGVDISGVSIPAEEVGGDFYDFIAIDKEKFALVIADVSGKGIPASLFMALARNTIRTEAYRDPNPKRVITMVNNLLAGDSESGMFVTAAYYLIDTYNKAITYVSAGHNNQALCRASSGQVEILKGAGRPLAVMEDSKFEEKVLFYKENDMLVLFTDGIIEAEKTDGEQFEEERTIRFIEQSYQQKAADFVENFQIEVLKFTEGNPFTDDFTLLVARL